MSQPSTSQKQRHGCLMAYLIFMVIANALVVLVYLLQSEAVRQNVPNMPAWGIPVLIGAGIFNLVCAFGLFKWKKWGFWGFALSAAVVFGVNIAIGLGIGPSLGGLIGVAILFGVLQIGTPENKGWNQLE